MPNENNETIRQLKRQTKVQENVIEEMKVRITMLESINQQQCMSTDLANTTYCFILAELTRQMSLKDEEIREKDQKLAAIQEILNENSPKVEAKTDGKMEAKDDGLDSLD